jgi:hypothetical protein
MRLFTWFIRDKLQTLKVGNGSYTLQIPKKYLWEYEDDVLAFYPKGKEIITIRVTVLHFKKENAKAEDFINTVIEEAQLEKSLYQYLDNETLLVENLPKEHTEDGAGLILQNWYVAKNTSLVVFTATIISNHADDSAVEVAKKDLNGIFRSVRQSG